MNGHPELCHLPDLVDDFLRRVADAGESALPSTLDAPDRRVLADWILELLASPERLRDFGICVSSLFDGELPDMAIPSADTLRSVRDTGPDALADAAIISDAELLRLALHPAVLSFLVDVLDNRPLPNVVDHSVIQRDALTNAPTVPAPATTPSPALYVITCELTPVPAIRPAVDTDDTTPATRREPPVFATVATKMGDGPSDARSADQWQKTVNVTASEARCDVFTADGPQTDAPLLTGSDPASVTVQVMTSEVHVALEGWLQPGERDVVSVSWLRGTRRLAAIRAAGDDADIVTLPRPLEETWLPGDILKIELLRSSTSQP